jgi:hypothetical protein
MVEEAEDMTDYTDWNDRKGRPFVEIEKDGLGFTSFPRPFWLELIEGDLHFVFRPSSLGRGVVTSAHDKEPMDMVQWLNDIWTRYKDEYKV